MTSAFHRLVSKLMGAAFAIFIGFLLMLAPLGSFAAASGVLMTGEYINDTVSVAESLQETITLQGESAQSAETKDEAVQLITAYISRYRNRSNVNKSLSFTTMQTALNAMAGHYKTFPKRPLPEKLKDRLSTELSKAKDLASKET